MVKSMPFFRLMVVLLALMVAPVTSNDDYGTLTCDPAQSSLKLRHDSNEFKAGLEPLEVNIPRQLCQLSFPPASCSIHDPEVKLPSADAIADAAKPKPIVLVVKVSRRPILFCAFLDLDLRAPTPLALYVGFVFSCPCSN